jgi:hypothetical protein
LNLWIAADVGADGRIAGLCVSLGACLSLWGTRHIVAALYGRTFKGIECG